MSRRSCFNTDLRSARTFNETRLRGSAIAVLFWRDGDVEPESEQHGVVQNV